MCLQITNHQWGAYDASAFSFESAGALAFTNECSGSAVLPARYMAFAERQLGLSRPTRSAALEVMMTRLPTQEFVAFVGIDWADTSHAVCLQAAGSDIRESSVLAHTPEAIGAWACMLRHRFSGRPIAVCLELTKGPLVSALSAHDFLVLFPVNAHTVAKYRQAFTPSRAKNAPRMRNSSSNYSSNIVTNSKCLPRKVSRCVRWSNLWRIAGASWVTRSVSPIVSRAP
jgi:hypothetical protein